MMKELKILVCGVNGAMGKTVVQCARETEGIEVAAGFDVQTSEEYPFPLYTVLSEIDTNEIDGVVDFSHYSVAKDIAAFCAQHQLPLVSATTGVDEETEQYYHTVSETIPVFRSKNFSYGISVMKKLLTDAARLLADDYDIEMIEMHHNKKADAPSGTAQMLLDAMCQVINENPEILYGRHGKDSKRKQNEITVHAVRGGTIVGEHSVLFAGEDEIITISHSARSKKVFAVGALKALKYICEKQNGFYTMDDLTAEGE
jgi:4-hydroxy-tetrahydrodipicolinate reductase